MTKVRSIAAEIVVAVDRLHGLGIRHIKLENTLIGPDGHVLLADFGLSKKMDSDDLSQTICGTTEYMSPEVVSENCGYDDSCDWWSVGVLLYELMAGRTAFSNDLKVK